MRGRPAAGAGASGQGAGGGVTPGAAGLGPALRPATLGLLLTAGLRVVFLRARWMSQNHSVVWVGRELKDHLVPTPLPWAGTLPLDQAAQSPIRPGLDVPVREER